MSIRIVRWSVTLFGGMMYSLLFAFGNEIERFGTCRMPDALFKAFIMFPVFSAVLWMLFCAENRRKRTEERNEKQFSTIGSFLVILVCWIPMYLVMRPGVFCVDTANQLAQIVTGKYSTHHPLLHTLLLKYCIDLQPVLGSLNRSAMLYSAGQMCLLAGCFSLTSACIARSCSKKAAKWSVAFFALHPLHMIYSVSATKDVLFSGMFVFFFALCVEIEQRQNAKKDTKNSWHFCVATIVCLLSGLLRNNMLYALVAWMLFLLVLFKRGTGKLFACAALSVLGIFVFGGLLQIMLQASDGDKREMLSWPIQQLARARVRAEEVYTEEEAELLDKIILKEKWREYDPRISDPVKGAVDTQKLIEHPKEYIDLYLSVGKKAPGIYFDAVLELVYPLIYPYELYRGRFDYVEVSIDPSGFDQCYGEGRVIFNERFSGVREWLETHLWKTGAGHIPFLRWIFNMGLIVWIMLYLVLREAWKGNWERFVIFLLPVFLWGTFLLGPVMYSRYVYPLLCSLPVLASCAKENK